MTRSKTVNRSRASKLWTGIVAITAATVVIQTLNIGPATAAPGPTDPPGTYSEQNLAETLVSPFAAYRIPALAYLGNNVVVAAWDGRPGSAADSPNPNSIVMRRSLDGGKTWGTQYTAIAGNLDQANGGANKDGYSDPSFIVDRDTNVLFMFSVYSKDQGFHGSAFGNDDADRQIISAQVSRSDDLGVTWQAPQLITKEVKPGESAADVRPGHVRSMFAASGEGIQLRYGTHAGRLIQQFTGDVRQADGSNKMQAYSVYSDNHGLTWKSGEMVGIGMDENKTVELSDGRVMLNSRDSAGSGFRKIAYSTDGGHSYGEVTLETQLIDPANNASITRLFPNAPQGSADAKKLLFTNATHKSSRANLTAHVSYDDGLTWTSSRTFRSSSGGYSTATRLGDGMIGVLYESSYSTGIQFAAFDDAWLDALGARVSASDVTVVAGAAGSSTITITNTDSADLVGATLSVEGPAGWKIKTENLPTIPGGGSSAVDAQVEVPIAASPGTYSLQATVAVATAGHSSATFVVTVPSGISRIGEITIEDSVDHQGRDLGANPYAAGDELALQFKITNTSTGPVTAVLVSDSLTFPPSPAAALCDETALGAGEESTCTTARHLVTAEDVARGYLVPDTQWRATSEKTHTTGRVLGTPVALAEKTAVTAATINNVSVTGSRSDKDRDPAVDPYLAGDKLSYTFSVKSAASATASVVPTKGNFAPFVPPGGGNCRFLTLAAGAGYECGTPLHTMTDVETTAGFFVPDTAWTVTVGGVEQQSRLIGAPVITDPSRFVTAVEAVIPGVVPPNPPAPEVPAPSDPNAGAGAGGGSQLEVTGAAVGGIVAAALAIIALGAGAMVIVKRRRNHVAELPG